ncbi:SDR family NAD(P)-dependent oxidoreductase [Pseudokordiimonas caeni]|uniref:SDR family NAD(P)-dependent oxidoreductase n=1 Tax=Pseudokordiimonas caeni TaxID=2997908 RepID=UPI002811BCFD|nr:SDR family oxidoreductase [Pseudokordiimonas caeni]
MQRFEGKRVILTGALGGIGQAIADRLSAEGARLGLMDRAETGCVPGVKSVAYAGADVADEAAVADAVASLADALGGIDILVNCAGAVKGEDLDHTDPATWRWNVDLNLNGTYNVTHAALPHLLANARSAIVNVSSVNAVMAVGVPAYSAAKAGMMALTRSLATEYAAKGLRANAVLPGTIRTSAWDERAERTPDVFEKVAGWYPGGALGRPEDVAAAVAFLAADEAAFVNGAGLVVDGGLSAGHHRMVADFI